MRVKVIKKFIDKHTGELHKPTKEGTILTIDKKRFDEIVSVDESLVEVVADEAPTEKKKPTKKAKKDTE